jgi:hypothetical protein
MDGRVIDFNDAVGGFVDAVNKFHKAVQTLAEIESMKAANQMRIAEWGPTAAPAYSEGSFRNLLEGQ